MSQLRLLFPETKSELWENSQLPFLYTVAETKKTKYVIVRSKLRIQRKKWIVRKVQIISLSHNSVFTFSLRIAGNKVPIVRYKI